MKQTVRGGVYLSIGPEFRLPERMGAGVPVRRLTATYYDTPDRLLASANLTLKRQAEGRRSVWQLDLPGGAGRLQLAAGGAPAGPPGALRDLLLAYVRRRVLVPVVTSRTRRVGVRVRGRGRPLADIALDAVTVRVGRRVVRRFHQLEVHPLRDDEAALARLVASLQGAGAGDGNEGPTLRRVLGLAPSPGPDIPPPDASPVEHWKALTRIQLAALLSHDPGTRLGRDPEALHQMRVATRRLRAYLRAARPLLARPWVQALRRELRWLGEALAPVRDLDVLLGYLAREAKTLELADRRALASLVRSVSAERAVAGGSVLDTLRSPRYVSLLDRLDEAARAPRVVESAASLEHLAAREFGRLRRAVKRLDDPPGDAELHAVRIRVKRARYAAELVEAVRGRPASRFIRAAKVCQDWLGEHQDAVVVEGQLRQLAAHTRGPRAAFAAGRLAERQPARRLAAREAFRSAWAELRRRGQKAFSD